MGSKSDQPELSFSWASPWTASTRCVYASVAISKEFNAIDNSACMHALLVGVTLAEVRGVSMLQISPISQYGGTRGNVCISKEFNAMDNWHACRLLVGVTLDCTSTWYAASAVANFPVRGTYQGQCVLQHGECMIGGGGACAADTQKLRITTSQ